MIRPTIPDDVATLVELTAGTGFFKPLEVHTLREVFDDYFSGADETHQCATLEDAGVLQGFVYFGPAAMTVGTWELWWIVVRKDTQGRGAGKRLLQHVEETIRRAAGHILFIETSSLPLYEPTRRFYLRNGYEQEAILRDYYSPGDGKIIFRKALG